MRVKKINNALFIQGKSNYVIVKNAPKRYLCVEVTKTNNDKWITVKPHGEDEKGRHLKLEGDETPKEAMKRQWGVDVDKKKQPSIEKKDLKTSIKEKSESRKKSDEHYSKYKNAQDKENSAREAWLEEDRKLRDFAKEKGLGLYDAQKVYPDKEKWESLRNERDAATQNKREAFSNAVNEISVNIKQIIDEYNSKTDDYIKGFDSIPNYLKETDEKIAKLRKERDEIYNNKSLPTGEKMSLLMQNTFSLRDVKNEREQKLEDQIQENLKALNKKDTKFKLKSKTASMGEIALKLSSALDGFIGDDVVPEDAVVEIRKLRKGGRAHEGSGAINVTNEDKLDVAIHEYMHFVEEKNPRILINSLAFAKSRTQNEKTQSLVKLTGNRGYKGEYAKKDKFFDAYCGKVYNPYDGYNSYANASASEIMSMGLQYIIRNPKEFAEKDREYFNFVIANIKGDI